MQLSCKNLPFLLNWFNISWVTVVSERLLCALRLSEFQGHGCIVHFIHPIHRFKSSDWIKEGHMTWIIFDNVRVWKLIHMCYFLLFPWLPKKLSQLPNLELNSLLSRFYGSVWTKKSMNGVYKTNIDCSLIRGMVENYCTLGKPQPWPTIDLGPTGLGE